MIISNFWTLKDLNYCHDETLQNWEWKVYFAENEFPIAGFFFFLRARFQGMATKDLLDHGSLNQN